MYSFLLANIQPEPSKKGIFNFNTGSLWKYGNLNGVSTVYIGTLIVLTTFSASIIIFGGQQDYIRPQEIRVFWYLFLGFFPIVISYSIFHEYVNRDSEATTSITTSSKKPVRKRK